jgi:hypothetical protein
VSEAQDWNEQLGAYVVVVGLGLPAASSAKNVYSHDLGIRSGPLGVETRRCSFSGRLRVAPSCFGRGRDAKAAFTQQPCQASGDRAPALAKVFWCDIC